METASPAPRRSGPSGLALLLPFFIFFVLFWLIPLLGSLKMSVYADTLVSAPEFVGLAHYRQILNDPRFGKAFFNTARYTVAILLIILPLALVLAQAVRMSHRRFRPALTFALLLPGLAPPAVLALLFLLVFHGEQGLLNQLLIMPFGGEPINWLKDPHYILPALVLQAVWRWTGFITFFFLAGMENIPRSLYEAAHLETNHRWQVWRTITVPHLRPVLVFAAVYLMVDAFAQFSGAYVLLGGSGGTGDAGLLLISYGYQNAFTYGKFGTAAAMSALIAPWLMGIFWLCMMRTRRATA